MSQLDCVMRKIHGVFNDKDMRAVMTKYRYIFFAIAVILIIIEFKPTWFIPGLIVSLFGLSVQSWCFASLNKNRSLSVRGPYLLTRNPMYLGRYFILLGFLMFTGNPWICFAFTFLYYFYMVNRVDREEQKLLLVFGDAYQEYCRNVNRFVPRFRLAGHKSLSYFSWKLFLKNNGHLNLIGVVIFFVVCTLCSTIHS
jgi:protein-S-isoprenylcysteine O-methyltransferase Ste14